MTLNISLRLRFILKHSNARSPHNVEFTSKVILRTLAISQIYYKLQMIRIFSHL